jgi:hypothetical protein
VERGRKYTAFRCALAVSGDSRHCGERVRGILNIQSLKELSSEKIPYV